MDNYLPNSLMISMNGLFQEFNLSGYNINVDLFNAKIELYLCKPPYTTPYRNTGRSKFRRVNENQQGRDGRRMVNKRSNGRYSGRAPSSGSWRNNLSAQQPARSNPAQTIVPTITEAHVVPTASPSNTSNTEVTIGTSSLAEAQDTTPVLTVVPSPEHTQTLHVPSQKPDVAAALTSSPTSESTPVLSSIPECNTNEVNKSVDRSLSADATVFQPAESSDYDIQPVNVSSVENNISMESENSSPLIEEDKCLMCDKLFSEDDYAYLCKVCCRFDCGCQGEDAHTHAGFTKDDMWFEEDQISVFKEMMRVKTIDEMSKIMN
jgi:hypothetical protein